MEITSIIILIGMIIIIAMFWLGLYKSRLSINEASDENAKKKKNIILVVEDIIVVLCMRHRYLLDLLLIFLIIMQLW